MPRWHLARSIHSPEPRCRCTPRRTHAGESIYVLRYATGQKYEAHTDHCHHAAGEALAPSCRAFLARAGGPACGPGVGGVTCGDRLATLILYLQ